MDCLLGHHNVVFVERWSFIVFEVVGNHHGEVAVVELCCGGEVTFVERSQAIVER